MSAQTALLARRRFLQSSLAVTTGFLGLRQFAMGAIEAKVDSTLVEDLKGVIDLPKGLDYQVLSTTGEPMSDGLIAPGYPDGMGAFSGGNGEVILVRNHELQSKGEGKNADAFRALGPFDEENKLYSKIDREQLFDRGESGFYPSLGGTTTLRYDPKSKKLMAQHLSLAGTERNCAGGVTPWGTWLTCEESAEIPNGEFLERHGYVFEVDPYNPDLQKAEPYREMGRFRREAVAVDPRTGIVYMTEDMGDGMFYRFIPNQIGQLGKGGNVQVLSIVGQPRADTRNWETAKGGQGTESFPMGEAVDVKWVDLPDPDSEADDLRYRGRELGGTVFARSEGIWYSEQDRALYFAATSGGAKELGQIFRYDTGDTDRDAKLTLFIEPNDKEVLKAADNLTIAPWGDIIFCEDYKEDSYIKGIRRDGSIYEIGFNRKSGSEFAGACFAPGLDDVLFVNIQKPGLTLAIHGMKSLAGASA